MEAGSVPAAPVGAEAAQTQAPAAPVADPSAQLPAAQLTPGQEGAPEGDVQGQLRAMEQRVKAAEDQLAQAQPQVPEDLVSALLGEEQNAGLTPEQIAAAQIGQRPGGQQQPDEEAQLAELDKFVQERIEKAVTPLEEQRQEEHLRAFQDKNPDIMKPEIFEKVKATLENLVQRYGDGAATDIALVEMAYRGVKAEMADAGAVPAEEAANHGASIETQAGQSQTGETSVEDEYKQAVFAGGAGGGEGFR